MDFMADERSPPECGGDGSLRPVFGTLSRVGEGELDPAALLDWQDMPDGEILRHGPTVWVTSDMHRVHDRSPVPIALYASSGRCTDFASRS